MTERKIIR